MNLKLKNLKQVSLEYLLKRRKVSLEEWVVSLGVKSYKDVITYCNRLGVEPPTENKVNNLLKNSKSTTTTKPTKKKKSLPLESIIDVESVSQKKPSEVDDIIDTENVSVENVKFDTF